MTKLKFPAIYSIDLIRDASTGSQRIVASEIKTTTKVENLKYKKMKKFSWNANERVAKIDVVYIESEEKLLEIMKMHMEFWEILRK